MRHSRRKPRPTQILLEVLEARLSPALVPLGQPLAVSEPSLVGTNSNANVAMDLDGNFTVAWQNNSTDGSGFGIVARRYNSQAQPVASTVRINTGTAGDQTMPSIGMTPDGRSVIAWSDGDDITAQRFDAAGNVVDANFTVVSGHNQFTEYNKSPSPQVFVRPSGDFSVEYTTNSEFRVTSFENDGAPGADRAAYTITYSGYSIYYSRRGKMDANGSLFLPIEWSGYDSHGNTVFNSLVRRIDPTGGVQDFPQVTFTSNDAIFLDYNANITPLKDGGFYVTFQAGPGTGLATGTLLGQRYGANGQKIGARTTLISNSLAPQNGGTLATLSTGDLVLGWVVAKNNAVDDSYVQIFSPDGMARGPAQLVVRNLSLQGDFGIATDVSGGFVLTWWDQATSGKVYAQRWVDTTPRVTRLGPVTPDPRDAPVASVDVTFSQPINASTFDYRDVTVTRDGGVNLITSAVTISAVQGNTYRIGNLAGLTASVGDYVLTVNAGGVVSSTGLAGADQAREAWTTNAVLPQVRQLGPVTPNPRTSAVSTIDVAFTGPIDPATFDFRDLSLTRNGGDNLITSAVKVAYVSGTTYRVSDLSSLTALNGSYSFAVQLSSISNSTGQTGADTSTGIWTMAQPAPQLKTINPVSPDPRTTAVDSIQVTLSQGINPSTFTYQDLTLRRSGGANLITNAVMVTRVSANTYRINNLAALTDVPGSYTLTVTGAGIQNINGSPASGSLTESWVRKETPTVKLDGTILKVVGTANNDWIQLRQRFGRISVDDLQILVSGSLKPSVATTQVTKIEINVASGDDTVRFLGAEAAGYENVILPTAIRGGAGNDTLYASAGSSTIDGEAGNDTLNGGKANDKLNGGAGADTLKGGSGNDSINGGDDSDILYGDDGNDSLTGGNSNDKLYGDAGNDTLKGGNGNDALYGGDGNDKLYGDVGEDILFGGTGKDTLYGGSDADTLYGQGNADTLYGQAGADQLNGGSSNDYLDGGDGNDEVNGGDGNDTLKGGPDKDTLNGGDGKDSLDGGDGNDKLFGNAGADALVSGKGKDKMDGGADADTFAGIDPKLYLPDSAVPGTGLGLVRSTDGSMIAELMKKIQRQIMVVLLSSFAMELIKKNLPKLSGILKAELIKKLTDAGTHQENNWGNKISTQFGRKKHGFWSRADIAAEPTKFVFEPKDVKRITGTGLEVDVRFKVDVTARFQVPWEWREYNRDVRIASGSGTGNADLSLLAGFSVGAKFDFLADTPNASLNVNGPVAAVPSVFFHGFGRVADVFINLMAAPFNLAGPLFGTLMLANVVSKLGDYHADLAINPTGAGKFTFVANVYKGDTFVKKLELGP